MSTLELQQHFQEFQSLTASYLSRLDSLKNNRYANSTEQGRARNSIDRWYRTELDQLLDRQVKELLANLNALPAPQAQSFREAIDLEQKQSASAQEELHTLRLRHTQAVNDLQKARINKQIADKEQNRAHISDSYQNLFREWRLHYLLDDIVIDLLQQYIAETNLVNIERVEYTTGFWMFKQKRAKAIHKGLKQAAALSRCHWGCKEDHPNLWLVWADLPGLGFSIRHSAFSESMSSHIPFTRENLVEILATFAHSYHPNHPS